MNDPSTAIPDARYVREEDRPTSAELLSLQSAVTDTPSPSPPPPVGEDPTRKKLRATETQLRDALAQMDSLKRSANAVRARLEAELQAAKRRAEQAQEALHRSADTAEELRVANIELTTALEATQWRLADLETESNVHQAEITRLQEQGTADSQRLADLEAKLEQLRAASTTPRFPEGGAAEGAADETIAALHAQAAAQQAELAQQLATLRAAHEDELSAWHTAAAEREAELVAARDALAHQLEDAHTRIVSTLTPRLDRLEAELRQACDERDRLQQELAATHDQQTRDRDAAAATAQERESEHHRALGALQAALQGEQSALAERLRTLEAERDAATRHARELEQEHATASAQFEEHTRGLNERLAGLEIALQQRDAAVAQLQATTDARQRQHAEALAAATAAADHLETELRQTREQLQHEIDSTRAAAERQAAERSALSTRLAEIEPQLAAHGERTAQLLADAEQRQQEHHAALQAAGATTARAEEELRRVQETLQREVDAACALAEEESAARSALAAQLQERDNQLAQLSAAATAAQARAQHAEEQLVAREGEMAAAALQVHATTEARIRELDEERSSLQRHIDELSLAIADRERDCAELRAALDAAATHQSEARTAHLEAKVTELERQLDDSAQRHAAAVNEYMDELKQRSEALRARETELQRVMDELALTKQACEDAAAQLTAQRQQSPPAEPARAETAAPAAEARKSPVPSPLRLAAAKGDRPAVGKGARPGSMSGPVTLIHLEENKIFREPVRDVIGRLPGARYLNTLDIERVAANGTRLLAVNLLNRAHDPLTAIAALVTDDADPDHVFAYCAEGSSGFSFGSVDFFCQPFDPDACVARLLESRGTVDRLLVVSENLDMSGALRTALSRIRCSTSVALDLRQVLDLLPMIEPNLVLVDLTLPRGDGLRLVSRLRADQKTRELPLAILLPPTAKIAEFRQHAARAARESPLSPADLAQALARRLGAPGTDGAAKSLSLQ